MKLIVGSKIYGVSHTCFIFGFLRADLEQDRWFCVAEDEETISLHHTTDPFLISMLVGSSWRRKMILKNNNTLNWSTGA